MRNEKTVAVIKNNLTGELAFHDTTDNIYLWEEGNYACDCNRELFFCRDKGYEPEHVECGNEKYSVRLYTALDGVIIYDEFEDL